MGENRNDPRAERLKAALRDNLRRRKAQVRGRVAAGEGEAPEPQPRPDPPEGERR